MRRPALLIALPLLLVAAGCGTDVAATSSSSGGGGGGHTSTSSTSSASTSSSASTTSSTSTGTGGTPAWCAPIPPGAPTGSGFTPAWFTPFGEAPPDGVQGPTGATVDAQGNTILTGWFFGTFDLGAGTVLTSPPGSYDGYLTKLSPEGKPLWLSEAENGASAAVAYGSNIWVSAVIADFTIARYDTSGAATWTWPIHPYGEAPIAYATGGDLWVANSFLAPSFDYGSGVVFTGGGAAGDIVLMRFDPSGAVIWAESLGDAVWPSVPSGVHFIDLRDMARAPDGGVIMVGNIADQDGNSVLVIRIDASGHVTWMQRLGPSIDPVDARIVADQAGNAVITLSANGETSFDVGCGPVSPAGLALLYVDAGGTPRWWRSWDDWNISFGAVGFDPQGDVLLAGEQRGPIDLGDGMLPWPDGSKSRGVAAKLSPSGVHLASRSFGDGPDHPTIDSLAATVTPTGEIIFAGAYTGTPDIGLTSGPLPTATTRTAFVTKLVP